MRNDKGSIRNIGIRKEHKRKKGKTETIGMIFAKENKNKYDKANDLSKQRINDVTFAKDKSKNIGLGSLDEDNLRRKCQKKSDMYPPEEVHDMFERTREGIEVKMSRVAAWSKTKARGLWLKKGYKIKRGMIIGVYGGRITKGVGPYVLQLAYEDGQKFRVDTEGGEDGARVYGMINEDIHDGETNAYLEDFGIIRAIQNMIGPCEILTDYGDEYDWDEVKGIVYKALKEELAVKEDWVARMKANNIKEARKGNGLEKYMARIIDGDLEPEELHSTTVGEG